MNLTGTIDYANSTDCVDDARTADREMTPPMSTFHPMVLSASNVGSTSVPRVLCVDDNVDACTMLAHILRLTGHGVETAHTALAAIQTAKAWRPDVVLLDIGLPEMDGYEVARRLRADPALKNTKLVAVTGYGTAGDVRLAREAGFDAHLLKPFEYTDVEDLLASWNESRSSSRVPEKTDDFAGGGDQRSICDH